MFLASERKEESSRFNTLVTERFARLDVPVHVAPLVAEIIRDCARRFERVFEYFEEIIRRAKATVPADWNAAFVFSASARAAEIISASDEFLDECLD
jgi:hypothetical protein